MTSSLYILLSHLCDSKKEIIFSFYELKTLYALALNLKNYSGSISDGSNKFGLNADTKPEVLFYDNDDDKFWLFDDDNEKDDNIENDDVFSSKLYDKWNYKKDFGENA
ncbi:hypothetical protein C1646_764310 [Rhizophagus diaphanus]|nr:hypothetical protein C1646_764310 [Rhizophagus diaphanus] [Rhizophagus sp. MUCL 43196]